MRFAVDARSQAAQRPFDHRLIVRETSFGHERTVSVDGIQALYAALAANEQRNRLILDDVTTALAEGRSPILLTERKDHLEFFAASLRGAARHLVVLRGGMTPTERHAAAANLAAIPAAEPRLLIATGRYIGEGFDDARRVLPQARSRHELLLQVEVGNRDFRCTTSPPVTEILMRCAVLTPARPGL